MNYDASWQALYDNLRAGMDGAGFTDVPLMAMHSQDQQTAEDIVEPPYVIYTQETTRRVGTMSPSTPSKVVKDGWRITVRARDLQEMLDIGTSISDKLELEDIADTTDNYVTTAVEAIGYQTLWEPDSLLHASHMRFDWERSK